MMTFRAVARRVRRPSETFKLWRCPECGAARSVPPPHEQCTAYGNHDGRVSVSMELITVVRVDV